jgi:hypothetical protein
MPPAPQGPMSIRDRVAAFLRTRSPRAICDACMADHLGLIPGQVCAAACWLADGPDFRRRKGDCAGCCTKRSVTVFA